MRPTDFRYQAKTNWGAMKEMLCIEFCVFWKTRSMLLYQVLMPVLYFVFIVVALSATVGSVVFNGLRIPYETYAIVGLIAMQMMVQMNRTVYRMVVGRQYGFFALAMQSGVKPFWYILVMSVSSVMGYAMQSCVFYLLIAVFRLQVEFPNFLLLWLIGLFGMYFWIGVAAFIAMFVDSYNMRDLVLTFIITPLSFSAPSFYVLEDAPFFVQCLATVNPLTYQLQAVREAAFGMFSAGSFGFVVVFSVISIAVASVMVGRAKLMTVEKT